MRTKGVVDYIADYTIGIADNWCCGHLVLQYGWRCGLLVLWTIGVVDYWCCGLLVLWNIISVSGLLALWTVALWNIGVVDY